MSNITSCAVYLSLLAWILFTFCVPASEGSIKCYSNVRTEQLTTENGSVVIETCDSPTSMCYETYEKDERLYKKNAVYKASCTGNCNNPTKEFCWSCNTTMCNNIYAKKIKTYRQCYQEAGEPDYGLRTEYCFNSVVQCYYQEYDIDDNKVRYFAGCGTGHKCNGKCHVCNTDLCNVPPKLQTLVQQRRQEIAERLAKAADVSSGTALVNGKDSNVTKAGNDSKSTGAWEKVKRRVDTDNSSGSLAADSMAKVLFPAIGVCIIRGM